MNIKLTVLKIKIKELKTDLEKNLIEQKRKLDITHRIKYQVSIDNIILSKPITGYGRNENECYNSVLKQIDVNKDEINEFIKTIKELKLRQDKIIKNYNESLKKKYEPVIEYNSKRISTSTRNYIFKRDNNICLYCKKRFCKFDLSVDHIIPRSKGGSNEESNLTTSCHKCNNEKGNLDLNEYLYIIR